MARESFEDLERALAEAISFYNNCRPHLSNNLLTQQKLRDKEVLAITSGVLPKEQISSIKFVYPCGRSSSGYAFQTTDRKDKGSQEPTATRLSPSKVSLIRV